MKEIDMAIEPIISIRAKVRLSHDIRRRHVVIDRIQTIPDSRGIRFLKKEALSISGEWIVIPEFAVTPEECWLPISCFADPYWEFPGTDGWNDPYQELCDQAGIEETMSGNGH